MSERKAGSIEYRFRYTDEYGRRKYKSVTGFTEDHCYEKAEQFLERLEQIKNTYSDVFDRMNLGAISKFESLMEEVMADE